MHVLIHFIDFNTLKEEIELMAITPVEFLTLRERAAMLLGAQQVLKFLEGQAHHILNPPNATKPYYNIPLMQLNQGVNAQHLNGISKFIKLMGERMGSAPLPLNKKPD